VYRDADVTNSRHRRPNAIIQQLEANDPSRHDRRRHGVLKLDEHGQIVRSFEQEDDQSSNDGRSSVFQ
jgi:hypothetical protein